LYATDVCGFCYKRGLFPEQVDRWRQAAQDGNGEPLLTMGDQKDFQKRPVKDQLEIKRHKL
jgi:hypothetical protein